MAPLVLHGSRHLLELFVFLFGPKAPLNARVQDPLPPHLALGGGLTTRTADLAHPGSYPLPILARFSRCIPTTLKCPQQQQQQRQKSSPTAAVSAWCSKQKIEKKKKKETQGSGTPIIVSSYIRHDSPTVGKNASSAAVRQQQQAYGAKLVAH